MPTEANQMLMTIKAQCLQLVALEKSFLQQPENKSPEVVDYVNYEKEMIDSLQANLGQWKRCDARSRIELEPEAAEVRQLIREALEIHKHNQTFLEGTSKNLKDKLEKVQKALRMVRSYPGYRAGKRVNIVG